MDNQCNTKLDQFNLDAFNVCCTEVHKTKYSMNMQYPIMGNLEIIWAPYHILWNLERYCVGLTKPRRNTISLLGYTITPWAKLFWSRLLEGYCSCSKGFIKHAISFLGYPINTFGSITHLWHVEGYCVALWKPTRKPIPSLVVFHN